MKSLFSLILITSLTTIMFFGFVALGHSFEHDNNNCIATTMTGVVCPPDQITAVTHHISSLVRLWLVPISKLSVLVLLIVSLLLVSFLSGFFNAGTRLKLDSLLYLRKQITRGFNFHKIKILRWLSLLENSPSL